MNNFIIFSETKKQYSWMNNFSKHAIMYNSKRWENAQSLFYALRFEDENIRELIRIGKPNSFIERKFGPISEKMSVKPTSRKDVDNMRMVIDLKLKYHQILRDALSLTGNKIIYNDVEHKELVGEDLFWGAVLDEYTGYWRGENMLGKIWEEARIRIRKQEKIK